MLLFLFYFIAIIKERAKEIFRKIDINNDGSLSENEFIRVKFILIRKTISISSEAPKTMEG